MRATVGRPSPAAVPPGISAAAGVPSPIPSAGSTCARSSSIIRTRHIHPAKLTVQMTAHAAILWGYQLQCTASDAA